MQQQRGIGKVEFALVLFAALLVAGEVFAIINGYGAFFAVVLLGYFMAAGAGYLVYRGVRSERTEAAQQAVTATATIRRTPVAEDLTAQRPAESHAAARQADLLSGLSEEQAEAVLALAHWDSIPAGTRLAEAGMKGDSIYLIIDGRVELSRRSDVGEMTVRVAGPGESFPLAALLGEGTLVTSATAMTDLMAYVVSRKQLTALCESRPDIGMTIYATVAEALADRYRSMLARHMSGVDTVVRQGDIWANV